MAANRQTISGVFTDINNASSHSSSDTDVSSSSTDSDNEKPYSMSSSIVLKFADRSLNAGLKSENPNKHKKRRRQTRLSQSIQKQRRTVQREEMRLSLDLSATISKLHQIQMDRKCGKPSEASCGMRKESHVSQSSSSQRVYSRNAHRLSTDNPFRGHLEHSRMRHTVSEQPKKAKAKQKLKTQSLTMTLSPRNSRHEPEKVQVLPPVIGVICSSPTGQCDGYFNTDGFPHSGSLSPDSITPLSSTSPGNSSIDLRAALSLTPSSRSESDEAHSPFPYIKGTRTLGRNKLPPISGTTSPSASIPDLNLQSSLDNPLPMSKTKITPWKSSSVESRFSFARFSMNSTSRSGAEDALSPLPPLKGTPTMGRKTLPPIQRNDSLLDNLTDYDSAGARSRDRRF